MCLEENHTRTTRLNQTKGHSGRIWSKSLPSNIKYPTGGSHQGLCGVCTILGKDFSPFFHNSPPTVHPNFWPAPLSQPTGQNQWRGLFVPGARGPGKGLKRPHLSCRWWDSRPHTCFDEETLGSHAVGGSLRPSRFGSLKPTGSLRPTRHHFNPPIGILGSLAQKYSFLTVCFTQEVHGYDPL